MRKLIAIAIVSSVITGCKGTLNTPPPLPFPPAAESRLRYRFAVPPPENIEKHPFTLYGKKIDIQKRIIRAIDSYSRFSTCVTLPKKDAGNLSKEIKYAKKKGADFLLRTDILLFQGTFQGRNSRVFVAYPLICSLFGMPLGLDVNAKTWRGEGIMEIKVIECASGELIYSSTVKAETLYNFSKYEELKERDFGKNYIRWILGGLVLNNLMVALVEDLNENFTESLVADRKEAAEQAPIATPTQTLEEAFPSKVELPVGNNGE